MEMVLCRARERSGKRSRTTRKSGEAEQSGERAWQKGGNHNGGASLGAVEAGCALSIGAASGRRRLSRRS